MYNDGFVGLSNSEVQSIDGGISLLVGAIIVGGTLVGDYLLDKQTGKNAVQWVGTGLSAAGKVLQEAGDILMN